jgi:YVTN family beta-propeller protein
MAGTTTRRPHAAWVRWNPGGATLTKKAETTRIFPLCILVLGLLAAAPAAAQTLIGTVNVGSTPIAAAANIATNKTYVANYGSNNVTVIDGLTLQTSTVAAGQFPYDIRVNPLTNKIYVSNFCGNDSTCQSAGTVTVIDGATNNTATVNVGFAPYAAAVNTVTNKIYVANSGGNTVTVIDGATNSTTNVNVGNGPSGLAVNPVTNMIYVPNFADNTITVINGATLATAAIQAGGYPVEAAVNYVTNQIYVVNNTGNTVTVIDGATNSTSTVNTDLNPAWVAVNQVTNQIYVANFGSDTVTVIDGATMNTTNVTVGNSPSAVVVDPVTNNAYVTNFADGTMSRINGANNHVTTIAAGNADDDLDMNVITNRMFVTNENDNTVSVIAGANAAPLQFVATTPCRLVDTRPSKGGSGPIPGGTSESFVLPQEGTCGSGIPSGAAAYSLNVTAIPNGPLGYLTAWPTGEDRPLVSLMNSDGRFKANAAIIPIGYQGAVSVYVTNTTNVLIDIDGYFTAPGAQTLQFYPLTPCRVIDTRNANGNLGGPFLNRAQERDFPVLESSCIPHGVTPLAYSFNVTVVPYPSGQQLGYLTVWPQGETQPVVSTLNNPTGTIVANGAVVPAGTGGGIAVYPDQTTQLVMDINGYFAAPQSGGLSLYPVAPCRVLDTRKVGNGQPFNGTLSPPIDVADSVCEPPSAAQGYVFNATVVPSGVLGYLTLWPDGANKPLASTLNANDGAVTSNIAILPSLNGKTDAFASGYTQLIVDISSYFAP